MNRVSTGWSIAALAAIAIALPAAGEAGTATARMAVFGVAHGPVNANNAQYVDAAPAGPSAGDVRTYYLPLTRPGTGVHIGYATGTLTTVATNKPVNGMELRTANLVFVIGHAADQIVVGGIAAYAESAPSVATRSSVTRPVIGGSGKFAGARGWCVSTHYANDTWTHVFHVTLN
jgi:hypothetical protein